MGFDIVFTDSSAGASAFYGVNVDADLPRQAAGVRSAGNRLAMLCSGNLAELHRHGKRGRTRLRLIGRERLLLGFSLSANGGLKGEPRTMLSRNMLNRAVLRPRSFSGSRGGALQGENYLANFYLLALFNFYFVDDAADRGGNFDHGFVRFEFHDRLAFGNFCAGRDHKAH